MEKHVTATEAVRLFSEILNFVNYRGDRYVIMRGKKAVADKQSGGWYFWKDGHKTWSYRDAAGNWVHEQR